MKLLIMQLLQPPAAFSLLGPNIPLSTLFSDTLNLYPSLSVRDHWEDLGIGGRITLR
jgi:hypothetical protein